MDTEHSFLADKGGASPTFSVHGRDHGAYFVGTIEIKQAGSFHRINFHLDSANTWLDLRQAFFESNVQHVEDPPEMARVIPIGTKKW